MARGLEPLLEAAARGAAAGGGSRQVVAAAVAACMRTWWSWDVADGGGCPSTETSATLIEFEELLLEIGAVAGVAKPTVSQAKSILRCHGQQGEALAS